MKREDFPEWTPPINGWQYRFTHVETDDLMEGETVSHALYRDSELYISYKSYVAREQRWFIRMHGTTFDVIATGATIEDTIAKFERQLKRLKREVAKL